MILYLIRFSLSLALLYTFYRLVLEKEKGYTFNRYYLLSGIVISLVVPFISMGGSEVIKAYINHAQPGIENKIFPWQMYITTTYLFITSVLIIRFVFDLYSLFRKIKSSDHKVMGQATIVLTRDPVSPHSFLNYVFINENQFKEIQPELLKHELTHVYQWHTLDVFIIELVKIFAWINPMLRLYKRAMQLNHEFLADQQVISTHRNLAHYQKILLGYLGKPQAATITSSLNFSLIKKRFSMMAKQKRKHQLLSQLLVLPVLLLVLLACSDNKGVSGKEMLQYWRYTANMNEILKSGAIDKNEADVQNGVIKPIETKQEYEELADIYNRMNKTQKESVFKLPPYIEPIKSD